MSVPGQDHFEVRYRVSGWDLLDWAFHYTLRSRVLLGMSLVSTAFIVWTSHRAGRGTAEMVVTAAMVFAVEWAAFLVLSPVMTVARHRVQLGIEIVLRVDAWGLRAESVRGSSEIPWATFERFRHGWGRTFLCLLAGQAIVVPHRAFDSAGAIRQFDRLCRGWIAAARDAQHAPS